MTPTYPMVRTPGPEQQACWSCGRWQWCNSLGYCKDCSLAGKDSPMIECTECGSVRRRRYRGEQRFTCRPCREPADA